MTTTVKRENPYDWYGEVIDPELFAGRKEELQIIEEELSRLANRRCRLTAVADSDVQLRFLPRFCGRRQLRIRQNTL